MSAPAAAVAQPAVVVAASAPPAPPLADAEPPRHAVIAFPKGMAPPSAAVEAAPVALTVAPAVAPAPVAQASKGPVVFAYGAETPVIVCAVSQLCDLVLQPGEKINHVIVGDPDHWRIEPATEGSGATETVHLIIRPVDPDLDTSLIVLTKTRTYHLQLQSHRKTNMLQVAFSYPGAPKADIATKVNDEDDGLVKTPSFTYVKGREPKMLGPKLIPAEPGLAIPRPEVHTDEMQP